MSTLARAIELAVLAHKGQTRRNGDPYILHPMRVMLKLEHDDARVVAILHDVVEDTDVTMEDLGKEGFSDQVLSALTLLTHDKSVAYEDYVAHIAQNPLAKAVKLADLEDNMNVRELPALSDRDLQRTAKYHKAWNTLKRCLDSDGCC